MPGTISNESGWEKNSSVVWMPVSRRFAGLQKIHALIFENYRRGLVRRFPYVIFYEFEGNTVTVYGVFHMSRDPDAWKQRLSG